MEKNRPVYVFQYPNGMQAPVENLNNIVDENGNVLPTPLTKEEIRDVRINIINGDNLK